MTEPNYNVKQYKTLNPDVFKPYRDALTCRHIVERFRIPVNGTGMISSIFNEEKTPSMKLWNYGFKDFSSGNAGDTITLVCKLLCDTYPACGEAFLEALRWIAKEAGLPMPKQDPEAQARYEAAQSISETYEEIWAAARKNPQPGIDYLISRGISPELAREDAGYLPRDYQPPNKEAAIKAGLYSTKGNFLFRDRCIIPIRHHGRIVNLYGRALDDSRTPNQEHVYCKTTDPPMPQMLWGLDDIKDKTILYITESIIDALSMRSNGILNTVAASGAQGLTPERAELLKGSKVQKCVFVFDSEKNNSGTHGALKAGEKIFPFADVEIVELPLPAGEEKVDPNTYFRSHSGTDFEKLQPRNLLDCLLQPTIEARNPGERSRSLKPVLELISRRDPLEWREFAKMIADDVPAQDYRSIEKAIKQFQQDKKAQATQLPAEPSVKKERPQYSANFEGLVDVVQDDAENPAFLMLENGEPKILYEATVKGIEVIPPPKDKIPILLPRGAEVLGLYEMERQFTCLQADSALFVDLVDFFKGVSELPTQSHYTLLAIWTLHTYLLEKFQYSPILNYFAVQERGKSRTTKATIYIAFRGGYYETVREAFIFRQAQNFGGALGVDCKDLWHKVEKAGSEDIFLGRFERGFRVGRVQYPDKGPFEDTEYYNVFGPTVLATNKPIHNILGTRSISITMPQTDRLFPNPITPEECLGLKERCVSFRLRNYPRELPSADKMFPNRLGDILRPLHQIIKLVAPDKESEFIEMAHTFQKEREGERAETLEAKFLAALVECSRETKEDHTEKVAPMLKNGKVSFSSIAEVMSKDLPDNRRYSGKTIGTLAKSLGIKTGKVHGGGKAVIWEEEKILAICQSYGVDVQTSLPAQECSPSYPSQPHRG